MSKEAEDHKLNREQIYTLIDEISKNWKIDKDRAELALKFAFIKTAKEFISWSSKFEIDFANDKSMIYEVFKVVPNSYSFQSLKISEGMIRLKDAIQKFKDDGIKVGDEIQVPRNLSEYGRHASATLYKNMGKVLEEFRGNSMYFAYKSRIGEKVHATVIHIDEDETTILDISEEDVRAVIKRRDRIKGEVHKVGDLISASIKYVRIDKDDNKITLELSRTNMKYLEALFKISVPEVKDGVVVIHNIARIPGERAKVAVSSNNPRVDPISAMIGAKGNRVNAVSKEVNNEIIDCVNYSSTPEVFIKNSLSPATIESIKITDETDGEGNPITVAYVSLEKKERGKAIGRAGVNLKLAKMLTRTEIRLITSNSKDEDENGKKASADEVLGALFN